MNLQEELKVLKQRIAELEEQAKEEQEFPQYKDTYYYIQSSGRVDWLPWVDDDIGLRQQGLGNVFRTREQAEFAVEKLKVEAELRKFSVPFKDNDNNYYIELYLPDKTLSIDRSEYFQTQGTIYFESKKVAQQAIETVGADRITEYIFEVED